MSEKALIVLAGDTFRSQDIEKFSQDDVMIIAADGGANTLADHGLRPHFAVGDFDSIREDVKASLPAEALLHNPDQDTTDFEKALDFAIRSKRASRIAVLGVEGDEPDHMLAALSAALALSEWAEIRFILRKAIVCVVRGPAQRRFATFDGARVSLIPLVPTEVRETDGLVWPVRGVHLSLGDRVSVSNRVTGSSFGIHLGVGALAVFVERDDEPPW